MKHVDDVIKAIEIEDQFIEYCEQDVIATKNAIKMMAKDAIRATLFYKILRFLLELTAVIILTCVSLMISALVVTSMFKLIMWLLGA